METFLRYLDVKLSDYILDRALYIENTPTYVYNSEIEYGWLCDFTGHFVGITAIYTNPTWQDIEFYCV